MWSSGMCSNGVVMGVEKPFAADQILEKTDFTSAWINSVPPQLLVLHHITITIETTPRGNNNSRFFINPCHISSGYYFYFKELSSSLSHKHNLSCTLCGPGSPILSHALRWILSPLRSKWKHLSNHPHLSSNPKKQESFQNMCFSKRASFHSTLFFLTLSSCSAPSVLWTTYNTISGRRRLCGAGYGVGTQMLHIHDAGLTQQRWHQQWTHHKQHYSERNATRASKISHQKWEKLQHSNTISTATKQGNSSSYSYSSYTHTRILIMNDPLLLQTTMSTKPSLTHHPWSHNIQKHQQQQQILFLFSLLYPTLKLSPPRHHRQKKTPITNSKVRKN